MRSHPQRDPGPGHCTPRVGTGAGPPVCLTAVGFALHHPGCLARRTERNTPRRKLGRRQVWRGLPDLACSRQNEAPVLRPAQQRPGGPTSGGRRPAADPGRELAPGGLTLPTSRRTELPYPSLHTTKCARHPSACQGEGHTADTGRRGGGGGWKRRRSCLIPSASPGLALGQQFSTLPACL